MNETIAQCVDRIHQAATGTGIDVSPSDVAFILSLFSQTILPDCEMKRKIVEELDSVRDE